ncbi:MAG: hypothetical protein IJ232_10055 [Lachnospiraceae bacterium]|nr:hypothetical protein [Lachnospiraceae bacterium]
MVFMDELKDACTTTFILPSLIEFCLNTYLENFVINEWLDGLKNLSGITFDLDEQKLVDTFNGVTGVGTGLIDGDKNTSLQKIWNMGVKYGISSFKINNRSTRANTPLQEMEQQEKYIR